MLGLSTPTASPLMFFFVLLSPSLHHLLSPSLRLLLLPSLRYLLIHHQSPHLPSLIRLFILVTTRLCLPEGVVMSQVCSVSFCFHGLSVCFPPIMFQSVSMFPWTLTIHCSLSSFSSSPLCILVPPCTLFRCRLLLVYVFYTQLRLLVN